MENVTHKLVMNKLKQAKQKILVKCLSYEKKLIFKRCFAFKRVYTSTY